LDEPAGEEAGGHVGRGREERRVRQFPGRRPLSLRRHSPRPPPAQTSTCTPRSDTHSLDARDVRASASFHENRSRGRSSLVHRRTHHAVHPMERPTDVKPPGHRRAQTCHAGHLCDPPAPARRSCARRSRPVMLRCFWTRQCNSGRATMLLRPAGYNPGLFAITRPPSSPSRRPHPRAPLSSHFPATSMPTLRRAATLMAAAVAALAILSGSGLLRTRAPRPRAAHPYVAPAPGDSRCPCPALNALANHGYLCVPRARAHPRLLLTRAADRTTGGTSHPMTCCTPSRTRSAWTPR
jgi:hypothetical protein